MNRRNFHVHLAATAAAAALPACAQPGPRLSPGGAWSSIESQSGGRMGIAILHADGRIEGHRLDERFPLCSTFKWLAGAHVLQRVDLGLERLDRRIPYGREVLQPHSPLTEK
ncbi:MAG TPA: twin-arginine translocation signal domain-containing protein, partial [Ramlibacter sp.]|nr:twin-arginine translocation signal domain-containing protein [Ramlibacter sp.]